MSDKQKVYLASSREPERSCPVCRGRLDGQTCLSLRNQGPVRMKLGDVSKCAYCGTILKLTEFGFLIADPKDLEDLPPILRTVMHEIPTLDEVVRGKKKKPS